MRERANVGVAMGKASLPQPFALPERCRVLGSLILSEPWCQAHHLNHDHERQPRLPTAAYEHHVKYQPWLQCTCGMTSPALRTTTRSPTCTAWITE